MCDSRRAWRHVDVYVYIVHEKHHTAGEIVDRLKVDTVNIIGHIVLFVFGAGGNIYLLSLKF